MIVVDYDNVAITCAMAQCKGKTNNLDVPMARAWLLNSLRFYRKMFSEHSHMFLCCDYGKSWRHDVFNKYKPEEVRGDTGGDDWLPMWEARKLWRDELDEKSPYPAIYAPNAEADDVIAVLTRQAVDRSEPVAIISSDHDLMQLQKYAGVKQYNPRKRKLVKPDIKPTTKYLHGEIIKGCRGDGIPNILSDEDTLVTSEKRQTPMTGSKFQTLLESDPKSYDEKTRNRYRKNQILIDFDFIPREIERRIIEKYDAEKDRAGDKSKLLNYLIENRMTTLIDHVQEF